MRKSVLFHRSLAFLALICVLTILLLMSLPDDLKATPEMSDDGTCISCHGTNEPTGPPKTSKPIIPYEPIPTETVEKEVNNGLLAGGLGFAALAIGGAIAMDKRKK